MWDKLPTFNIKQTQGFNFSNFFVLSGACPNQSRSICTLCYKFRVSTSTCFLYKRVQSILLPLMGDIFSKGSPMGFKVYYESCTNNLTILLTLLLPLMIRKTNFYKINPFWHHYWCHSAWQIIQNINFTFSKDYKISYFILFW